MFYTFSSWWEEKGGWKSQTLPPSIWLKFLPNRHSLMARTLVNSSQRALISKWVKKFEQKNGWKTRQKEAWIQEAQNIRGIYHFWAWKAWFQAQNIRGIYHFWAWKAWFQALKMHKNSMEHSFKLRIEFLMFCTHRAAQERSEVVQEGYGKVEEDLGLTWKRVKSGHRWVHGWFWKDWGWPRGSWDYMGWGRGGFGGFRLD